MNKKRIGIIGSGYMSKGVAMAIERQPDMEVSRVLTRGSIAERDDYPAREALTQSIDSLIAGCDLVVECSGDVLYGTEVLDRVLSAGLPVVTMNVELMVTTGTYLAKKGPISEIEGDQPGSLAALHESIVQMGFRPLVYGNVKGFQNLNPARADMEFWGRKQGISLDMVTSFTDGTKLQYEQALVANGLGCGIAAEGLLGLATGRIEEVADELALTAQRLGHPISEYILSRQAPPGVFIVAEHDGRQKPYLQYYKMGDGPFYTIVTPYHMCHLEGMKTIRRLLTGGDPLINNSPAPTISVAAVAKRDLQAGERIRKGSGSFELRGMTVRIADHPDHVPLGLLNQVVVRRPLAEGAIIRFEDVEIPDSLALAAWKNTTAGKTAVEAF